MARKTTVLLLLLAAGSLSAQEAVIRDAQAKERLLGAHVLRLQWIEAGKRDLGRVQFTETDRVIRVSGTQRGAKGDSLSIEGVVTSVDKTEFTMTGRIVTLVSHINSGRSCERSGVFTFHISGPRPFYRLKEMQNPCEDVVDYVDIYVAPASDPARPAAGKISHRAPGALSAGKPSPTPSAPPPPMACADARPAAALLSPPSAS